jgi:hypothetical protein
MDQAEDEKGLEAKRPEKTMEQQESISLASPCQDRSFIRG